MAVRCWQDFSKGGLHCVNNGFCGQDIVMAFSPHGILYVVCLNKAYVLRWQCK